MQCMALYAVVRLFKPCEGLARSARHHCRARVRAELTHSASVCCRSDAINMWEACANDWSAAVSRGRASGVRVGALAGSLVEPNVLARD